MQSKNSPDAAEQAAEQRRIQRLKTRRYTAQTNATPRQRAELARRKSQGIGLVLSPTKFLRARIGSRNVDTALLAQARRTGYGSHIQRVALRVANGGQS